MLSMESRYALKALLHLARVGGDQPRSTAAIALAARIPRKFLESILVRLKRGDILISTLGKHGGYRLAHAPDRISFAQVIRVTDGPISLLPCVSKNFYRRCDDCPDEASCDLRRVMLHARDQILAVLETTTLADAVASGGEHPLLTNAPAPASPETA